MIVIKGGAADKLGKKCKPNLSTMFIGSIPLIGIDSMLMEKELREEKMNEIISNPLISRKGKVY